MTNRELLNTLLEESLQTDGENGFLVRHLRAQLASMDRFQPQGDASDLMPAESIESSPAQNEAEPPEIIFEDGKAVVRPHTTTLMPVSTFRLTFQDGEEMDISSDLEFAGLDEEEFRIAYDAFERTRADLFGKTRAPELNSKEQRDLDSGQN